MTIEHWGDILSLVGTIAISLGVIAGGVWTYIIYRRERRKFPKANLSHKVRAVQLTDDKVCVHTSVTIKSVGDVMLEIRSAHNVVYQIQPLDDQMQQRLRSGGKLYDEVGKEIAWTEIGRRDLDITGTPLEIEPGEEDTIHFDVIICSDAKVVQVYTYFENVVKRKREIGWPISDFFKVAEIAQIGG